MRSSIIRALRGLLAGFAGLSFLLLYLLLEARVLSIPAAVVLFLVGIGSLAGAVGSAGISRLFRITPRTSEGNAAESEWWLARLEPTLEESWNRWSDLVLALGLGVVGVGALVLVALSPDGEPPLGLLVVALVGINGSLISLAFVGLDASSSAE
ncbi:hypothetical protein [Halostagnicola sp. A-GB9-2]|uniref:hypothetical protein n=1 Tax=Halostagnicola sp. A-GB9-2 TaxID=3048066 RepID=UPI0024C05E83|nr:hypothetical protein [Halostagnicola sp. A-GB9-2]MDJ1432207.1 hypothetical protein [Halostagnicola sp. A-GB9-2]